MKRARVGVIGVLLGACNAGSSPPRANPVPAPAVATPGDAARDAEPASDAEPVALAYRDGLWLATNAAHTLVAAAGNGEVQVWSLPEGTPVQRWKPELDIGLAFAGDTLIVNRDAYEPRTGTKLAAHFSGVHLAATDDVVVTADTNGLFTAWNIDSSIRKRAKVPVQTEGIAVAPDGSYAAVCDATGLDLITIATGQRTRIYGWEPHPGTKRAVFIPRDSGGLRVAVSVFDRVAVVDLDGKVHLEMDTKSPGNDGAIITDLAVTADRAWIVASANLVDAIAWRVSDGTRGPRLATWPEVSKAVAPIGGSRVAMLVGDEVRFYDVATGGKVGAAGGAM